MTICDFDVFVRIHLHTRSSSVRSRHWSLSQFIWMSKRTWCTSMLHLSLTTVCVMCTMQPIQDDQATEKQPNMFLSSIHPPLRWQGEQYKTWTKYKRKTHVFTLAFFSTNICLTNFVNIHTSLPSFFLILYKGRDKIQTIWGRKNCVPLFIGPHVSPYQYCWHPDKLPGGKYWPMFLSKKTF